MKKRGIARKERLSKNLPRTFETGQQRPRCSCYLRTRNEFAGNNLLLASRIPKSAGTSLEHALGSLFVQSLEPAALPREVKENWKSLEANVHTTESKKHKCKMKTANAS